MTMKRNYLYARERKYTDCVYEPGETICSCATCTSRLAAAVAKRERRANQVKGSSQ